MLAPITPQPIITISFIFPPVNDVDLESDYSGEILINDYVPILFPSPYDGGKPITISHPMIFTIASNSEYQNDIKEILKSASLDFELNAKYATENYHFPVLKSAINYPCFANNEYLNSNLYMLDYTTFTPNYINIDKVIVSLYDSISEVETGNLSPKEAYQKYYN